MTTTMPSTTATTDTGARGFTPHARMSNPALVAPGALSALRALNEAAQQGVPKTTIHLIHLRASQINGCGVCVDMHARDMKREGEPDTRIFAVAAWRDTPYFSEAERAALALTEAVTRLADRPAAVPDEIWHEVSRHYDEAALATILLQIALINVWNRLNVATQQVAGGAW